MKKVIFRILLHIVVKIKNKKIASIMDDSVIICDDVIQDKTQESRNDM